MPASGPDCVRYGGHTTCYSLETDQGLLIVDAGTGIASLGAELLKREHLPPMTLLFTHFHADHLVGLPHFSCLYDPRCSLAVKADGTGFPDWIDRVHHFLAPPFWPVAVAEVPADVTFGELDQDAWVEQGVRVSRCALNHPQPCLALRLETDARTIVIATDHEPGDPSVDERLVDFCRGAHLLVADAQFSPEEMPAHRGWGHGSWESAAQLAREAGVGELILTHHAPSRTDDEVDAWESASREIFPATRAGRAGMTVQISAAHLQGHSAT